MMSGSRRPVRSSVTPSFGARCFASGNRKRRSFVTITIALTLSIAACRQSGDDRAHIQHIESGLLPAVIVKGEPAPPAMKLADRMAHYAVPGVSIAVINDGQLDWAKGYGVLEAG